MEDAGTSEGMLPRRLGWSQLQRWSPWCNVQGPAYNRHTLPGETEPVGHAKEILILRHKSLRVEVSGGDTASTRKEKDDSYSAQGDSSTLPKLCRSFTVGNAEKVREVKQNRSKSVCVIPPPQPSGTAWGEKKEMEKELTLEM